MSTDYVEAIVGQTIPTECLTTIETWLLTRIFKTETRDGRISFVACRPLNDLWEHELYPDDELATALFDSRINCPELCAAVVGEINKSGKIILGAVNYKKIFQSIIRRRPDLLRHVSIQEFDRNAHSPDDESFTLITADAIETIRTAPPHQIKRGKPASSYIIVPSKMGERLYVFRLKMRMAIGEILDQLKAWVTGESPI